MGRRPIRVDAAVGVSPRAVQVRVVRQAVSNTIVTLVLLLIASRASAEHLGKGSTSRADRDDAKQAIPFERLTVEARQKIARVVENPSLFRRMPSCVIDCDPQMHRFLVRYPEVVVNIWQLMGITKVTADRQGPFLLNAQDGVGTTTQVELVYGDHDKHLMYCEGVYDGPLFRRPLTGRCVLLLRSDYSQTEGERWKIVDRMDIFLQIDNIAIDAVTRTLHPLLGKSADVNFVQSTHFLQRICRTSEENGEGMKRLAQRLDNVRPDVRDEFAKITESVYLAAKRGPQTVALNADVADDRANR